MTGTLEYEMYNSHFEIEHPFPRLREVLGIRSVDQIAIPGAKIGFKCDLRCMLSDQVVSQQARAYMLNPWTTAFSGVILFIYLTVFKK